MSVAAEQLEVPSQIVPISGIATLLLPEQCEALIAEAKRIGFAKGKLTANNVSDDKRRDSSIVWLADFNRYKEVYEVITKALQDAAKYYGFDVVGCEAIQISRYKVGQFYGWHTDLDSRNGIEHQRKISMSIELSKPNSYNGGVLTFDNLVKEKNGERGTATAFPSYLRHRVTPVTKGERYSLVVWGKGPRFR